MERYHKKEQLLTKRIEYYAEFERFIELISGIKQRYALTPIINSFDEFLENIKTRHVLDNQSTIDSLMQLFQSVLDCTIRTYSFHLTARYWEARWLLEDAEEEAVQQSAESNIRKLRQYCMLAPCLVATTHSLPKLFKLPPSVNGLRFILNEADLLIIDEAGQASPEISIANFGLAKKAIVVGDVEQLKPVWNFEKNEDKIFLEKFKLTTKTKELTEAGCRVSSGSIMMMAHHATKYSQDQKTGILLRSHYRCVPTIIEFCNELVYAGQLIPIRKHQSYPLFHPMSFVECYSSMQRQGESWRNKQEAHQIAKWLYEKKAIIENYYQNKQNKKPLYDLVAIVTPYNAQIYELKNAVAAVFGEEFSHDKITIGTVHALQGAEKPIVIFSAVTTPDQDVSSFLDRDTDMLNVAVSRAQDCFILFGHPDVFFNHGDSGGGNLPSVVLGKYMKEHGKRLFPRNIIAVESPSKAKLFESYLGCDYKVIATVGHFRDLDIEGDSLDFSKGMRPVWKINPEKQSIITGFERYLSDADKLIFATDNDREGEAISWHLKEVLAERLPLDNLIMERVRFASIDKITILESIAHPEHALDLLLVRSALARRIIDYLLGKKLTQLVTRRARLEGKKNDTYGIGRVQAALLYLLKDREEEIAAFKPKKYWAVSVVLEGEESSFPFYVADEDELLAVEKKFFNEEEAVSLVAQLKNEFKFVDKSYDEQRITFGKAKPMTTAEVLKQASEKYGLLPKETIDSLQSLYDGSYENK